MRDKELDDQKNPASKFRSNTTSLVYIRELGRSREPLPLGTSGLMDGGIKTREKENDKAGKS